MSTIDENQTTLIRIRRPFKLALLVLFFLSNAIKGFLTCYFLYDDWQFILSTVGAPGVWYMFNRAFVWGILSLLSAILLWIGSPFARVCSITIFGIISGCYWLEILVFAKLLGLTDWPIGLLFNVILWTAIIGILYSPDTSAFLRRKAQ